MARETYPEFGPRTKTLVPHRFSPGAEWALIVLIAGLLLIPCFWQPRIIAGDLSSHLYNAWLAGQIEQGQVPGQSLTLAHPITNVLADWALERLLPTVGPSSAERIVAGAAVEIFFWGAFFFVVAATEHRCWVIAPSLGMITYGMIFHLGFLNFFISTGFSLWLLALLWRPRRPWLWLAIPCAALALLAHPFPLAWAVAALLYVHGARRVPESYRAVAFIAGACLMILVQTTLVARHSITWSLADLIGLDAMLGLTGTGQVWLYGPKYLMVVSGILLIWSVLLFDRVYRGSFLEDPVVHIWGLSMLGYILLPSLIQFPGYRYPLEFMQVRASLFIAVLFCVMVAGGSHRPSLARASCLLAATFFTMMYLDAKSLNQVEAEIARLVSAVPPGTRVVTALADSASPRLDGLIHAGSAACLGHCWDYGNYEPATGQFRIRVSGPNGVVVDNMRIVAEIESGRHVVTPQEAPLYNFCPPKTGDALFELRKLAAGETTCLVLLPATALR
jgi:hypothetical protein